MALDPAPPETPTDPAAKADKTHERAKDRFQLCEEGFHDQRDRELEDLRFIDERGAQWPDDIRAARSGQAAGGGFPAIGARPCLEFNLLRGPVQQVINTARQAKLGLSFTVEDDELSSQVASLVEAAYDDIARSVQTDSRA